MLANEPPLRERLDQQGCIAAKAQANTLAWSILPVILGALARVASLAKLWRTARAGRLRSSPQLTLSEGPAP